MASEERNKEKKMNFFQKIKNSIFKIEKYPEMSVEGAGRAISYISKLIVVLAIILGIWSVYQTYSFVKEGTKYLENEFPEFSYNDGTLDVNSESEINLENEKFGKIIIDTKTDSEEKINQYSNDINSYGMGIIILKDKVILKNSATGDISYNYKENFQSLNITQFSKKDVINYASGSDINKIYFSIFITIFIYGFIIYYVKTLWYAIIIAFIGYITAIILKMKMRYIPIFNMAIYSLTLSTLLNILYLMVNTMFEFTMEYFGVMYITVATIYLIASIFMIKSDFIKKQSELTKVVETENSVKNEIKEKNKEEEEKEKVRKKDEEERKTKEKNKKSKGNLNEKPEESNA